ncbi:MAG TPA: hypothetical protein ACHBZ9_05150 [Arsenophonus nasoniae]|uniref:hypothetical protein n=1 Tax=Arsenophonus nasoniae TaxID=638 RepID=UPI00387A2572
MKKKTRDFKEDIFRLRSEGMSYENIAIWLAANRSFAVTGAAIRSFIKSQKVLDALNK